jgi:hypothetical protein
MTAGRLVRARLLAAALIASFGLSCTVSGPAIPSIELPSFDTAAVEQLVQDAIAEVERLAQSPPPIALPPDLASLLEQNNIALPPLPSNAAQICEALGTPGVAGATGAGLSALIETLAAAGEAGPAIGLLVTVVFSTCPIWSPHLETALEGLL